MGLCVNPDLPFASIMLPSVVGMAPPHDDISLESREPI
jgi:hypothetical protein